MDRLVAKVVGLAAFLCAAGSSPTASAQDKPTLSGSWSASALTEAWKIGDWGDACGPRPAPRGAGGGSVRIKQSGNELSMSGAGRTFSTAECWEQMPGLSRTAHSASGGGRYWRTRCNTPSNDPRQATIVTTIQATDNTISLTETGQYQFVIHDQNCTAAVTRSRSFTLVRREGEAEPVSSAAPQATPAASEKPAPAAKPASKCTGQRGEAARLEVYPGKKLMKAGDRFVFRAAVLDAEGCALGLRPKWSIVPGPLASKASVEPGGTVVIAEDAGEGRVDLAVGVGGKGVTIPIQIASAENYEALLASAKADGEQAAVAVIATGTIGGRAGVAEDAAKERKVAFVAIVGGLAACLAFFGLVLFRRGRRAERPSMATESIPMAEPELASSPGEAPLEEVDAEAAVPRAERPKKKRAAKGKICPTCGDQYPPEATFCGKDATTLVLLN